jgi:hypothetical protein
VESSLWCLGSGKSGSGETGIHEGWGKVGGDMKKYPYCYIWKNNEKRKTLYGRLCRVIIRSKANSALVEFDNGQKEVISRNAIRNAP